jgi:exosortase A-associated hydrolase 1
MKPAGAEDASLTASAEEVTMPADLMDPGMQARAEEAVVLSGSHGPMIGILHRCAGTPIAACAMIAGQPQTRVGSHRVFVRLARGLAASGIAVLRFDCSGWGDSPGVARPFEQSAPDIAAAVEALATRLAPGTPLALVGLCDGATAAALALDDLTARGLRLAALTLVNPWVRSEGTREESLARTYYARKAFDVATLQRVLRGELRWRAVFSGIRDWMDASRSARRNAARRKGRGNEGPGAAPDLATLLRDRLERHPGVRVSVVLSGRDLTAGEFEALLRRDPRLQRRLRGRDAILRLSEGDHMLSDRSHQAAVVSAIAAWFCSAVR